MDNTFTGKLEQERAKRFYDDSMYHKTSDRLCVNSTRLLAALKKVMDAGLELFVKVTVIDQKVHFGSITTIDCMCRGDFQFPIYKENVEKLIKHLEIFSDQPITLQVQDSQVFNVKIIEAYV